MTLSQILSRFSLGNHTQPGSRKSDRSIIECWSATNRGSNAEMLVASYATLLRGSRLAAKEIELRPNEPGQDDRAIDSDQIREAWAELLAPRRLLPAELPITPLIARAGAFCRLPKPSLWTNFGVPDYTIRPESWISASQFSELIRQALFSSFWNPATVCHPRPVAVSEEFLPFDRRALRR